MSQEFNKYAAEFVSGYIELFAILLISFTIVVIILNNLIHFRNKDAESFSKWRNRSWRGIQGSLDLFVASDLLSTITINRTLDGVVTLGILLVVRTLISWSLEVEAEGCWPWQKKRFELLEKQNSNN
jgi:uncharacterized membrane protein